MQGQCSLLERKESSPGERDLVCRSRGVSAVAAMTQGRRRVCLCVVSRDDTGGDVCVSVCVWLAPYLTRLLFFCFLIIKNTYLFGCVAS